MLPHLRNGNGPGLLEECHRKHLFHLTGLEPKWPGARLVRDYPLSVDYIKSGASCWAYGFRSDQSRSERVITSSSLYLVRRRPSFACPGEPKAKNSAHATRHCRAVYG